ncbi:MAG: insulinase family protein [Deltaproteobacteria bacterium]|nr:MAG: insulinase family protein [Deltaproteobacteria bacterium]
MTTFRMPSKLWRLSTLAALLVAAAAHADKQAPPPPAPPRPFALPQHQDVALDNGARITTVPYGAVPKATIELFIRGGASEDSAQQVWLSELMGTSLGEGTRSRPAAQLAQAAAAMGGDLDVTVEPDQITIAIEVLSEFAPRAIALVADVVRNPTFPPAARSIPITRSAACCRPRRCCRATPSTRSATATPHASAPRARTSTSPAGSTTPRWSRPRATPSPTGSAAPSPSRSSRRRRRSRRSASSTVRAPYSPR